MKMNMKKITHLITVFGLLSLVLMPMVAMAQVNFGLEYGENIGLGNNDPRDMAGSIIQVVLGFLGIIAVIIILIGGFKWMTAGGNEEKVTGARKLIVAGIIGLAIILAAWGISNFVISALMTATA